MPGSAALSKDSDSANWECCGYFLNLDSEATCERAAHFISVAVCSPETIQHLASGLMHTL